MKMEAVQAELQHWSEILITTAGGDINGDGVEAIKKHYGHPVQ